ncbi:MAG: hypothetical protein HYZ37_12695 [Candidatus Solibacter usitatus]|nr:hypothetical protein [Candidatus Solibacter usitatus]
MSTHIALLMAALAWPGAAQSPIRGPLLGWAWDSRTETLRPILGITGSSLLGKSLDVGAAVKHAAVASGQDVALAILGDHRTVARVHLKADVANAVFEEIPDGAGSVVLSTSESAALVWHPLLNRIYVVTGWRTSAPPVWWVKSEAVGSAVSMAVSDDGEFVLAISAEGSVSLLERSGARVLWEGMGARGAAFLENSRTALIASATGVWVARDLPAWSDPVLLRDGESWGTVAAIDGQRALLTDRGSQSVLEVNLATGEVRSAQCPCMPAALSRLNGDGVYRLNELGGGPLWLAEISEAGIRTVFVPPDPPES